MGRGVSACGRQSKLGRPHRALQLHHKGVRVTVDTPPHRNTIEKRASNKIFQRHDQDIKGNFVLSSEKTICFAKKTKNNKVSGGYPPETLYIYRVSARVG